MLNKINISPGRQKLIVCIVLTIATLAVFWQVKHFNFINYDDGVYVTHNIHIQSGRRMEFAGRSAQPMPNFGTLRRGYP